MKKIFISAGEESGDLHGAALLKEAQIARPDWKFWGLGGERMAACGFELVAHLKDTAFMGLKEIFWNLPKIFRARKNLLNALKKSPPQAVVLIDSPDFNFALAKVARALKIPVIYYICPQVWAWRKSRLKFLQKYTTRRALIFPFELDFYRSHGVTADLVGHPLLDEIQLPEPLKIKEDLGYSKDTHLLALLPGSRPGVFARLAPTLLEAVRLLLLEHPNLEVALPRAHSLPPAMVENAIDSLAPDIKAKIRVFAGRSQEILKAATLALLVSGTAAVEATLLGTPMVVTYKAGFFSFKLAKLMVKTPYVSIPNLLAKREIVPELLQKSANPKNIQKALNTYLTGPPRSKMLENLAQARASLGGPGASFRVLEIIFEEIGGY
ncbi:MAG: lipid-A-disaccharide synthase [Deltaproteobacteria bacterium]|nr:lipid-A-disaccharide synthase [Deltaproteobacteria bacterium]